MICAALLCLQLRIPWMFMSKDSAADSPCAKWAPGM